MLAVHTASDLISRPSRKETDHKTLSHHLVISSNDNFPPDMSNISRVLDQLFVSVTARKGWALLSQVSFLEQTRSSEPGDSRADNTALPAELSSFHPAHAQSSMITVDQR